MHFWWNHSVPWKSLKKITHIFFLSLHPLWSQRGSAAPLTCDPPVLRQWPLLSAGEVSEPTHSGKASVESMAKWNQGRRVYRRKNVGSE